MAAASPHQGRWTFTRLQLLAGRVCKLDEEDRAGAAAILLADQCITTPWSASAKTKRSRNAARCGVEEVEIEGLDVHSRPTTVSVVAALGRLAPLTLARLES